MIRKKTLLEQQIWLKNVVHIVDFPSNCDQTVYNKLASWCSRGRCICPCL